jgi:hypothetical protein
VEAGKLGSKREPSEAGERWSRAKVEEDGGNMSAAECQKDRKRQVRAPREVEKHELP